MADDITCRLNANSVARVYSAFLPALTVYLLASILSMDFEKIFEKLIFVRFIGHMTCYYTLRKQTNVYKYIMEGQNMKEREELIRYISNLTEADMKKIIQRLPELISKLEAQGLPVRLLKDTHIE